MMRPVVQAPSMSGAPSQMPSSGPSAASNGVGKDTTPSFLTAAKLAPSPFSATPPLAKLTPQLPSNIQNDPALTGMVRFLQARAANPRTPQETPAPDIRKYSLILSKSLDGENGQVFPLLDILRTALVDTRCVGQFVEPAPKAITGEDPISHQGQSGVELVLIPLLAKAFPASAEPLHSLHVTILRTFVNLLHTSVPLAIRLRLLHELQEREALGKMSLLVIDVLTRDSSAVDAQSGEDVKKVAGREKMAKVAAAKLAWAIAGIYHGGSTGKDAVSHELRLEVLAAVVEALRSTQESGVAEDKAELRDALVRSIGLLCHVDEAEGVWDYRDLCDALDVKGLLHSGTALEAEVRKILGS
jgi:hypothetical protein